jgi:UDP-N-acetylmuramate--alanine ligase
MNYSKIKKIYMIGIKGVGMTMLAQYLVGQGIEVIGSDTSEKFMTDEILKKTGIAVLEKYDKSNIPDDADLIIYSTAYNSDNQEVAAALASHKKTLTYAEALGAIFNTKFGIAVAGSHGKTTTTAWLGYVLAKAGKSPSVMVGASVPQFNGASLSGKSDYLVIEADEYQNKFKYFDPKAVLLNNIDYDHPDFFPTEQDYISVFLEFIKRIPKNGFLVANFDDQKINKIANVNCRCKVIGYAIKENADYIAYDIKNVNNKILFKVKLGVDKYSDEDDNNSINTDNQLLGEFSIQLAGIHNVYNALAVIATCVELDVNLVDIRTYLDEFIGVARRLQILGEYNGTQIIDDYAHHPTEIKATLSAAKSRFANKKITVVFHPHTFTRTKALFDDFSLSFKDADKVIILDIYGSAREKQGGVTSSELVDSIKKNNPGKEILYLPDLKTVEEYLRYNVDHDEIVLLMGAGDVFRIGENLVK